MGWDAFLKKVSSLLLESTPKANEPKTTKMTGKLSKKDEVGEEYIPEAYISRHHVFGYDEMVFTRWTYAF